MPIRGSWTARGSERQEYDYSIMYALNAEIYGNDPERGVDMTIADLKNKFIEIYGGTEEGIRVFSSPGRVNLIGEHTDYNGGYVFPPHRH